MHGKTLFFLSFLSLCVYLWFNFPFEQNVHEMESEQIEVETMPEPLDDIMRLVILVMILLPNMLHLSEYPVKQRIIRWNEAVAAENEIKSYGNRKERKKCVCECLCVANSTFLPLNLLPD